MKTPWICLCSPEYRPLLDRHFLPSFAACGMDADFDLRVLPLPDRYPNWEENGWQVARNRALRAAHAVVRCHGYHGGTHAVVSGADFRFYQNPRPFLFQDEAASGIMFSMDRDDTYCTDFMAARLSPSVFDFLDTWLTLSESGGFIHDQSALNWLAHQPGMPVWAAGPEFWTAGLSPELKDCPWEPGELVPIPPKDMVLHHGNFAISLTHKLALMDAVQAESEAHTK